MAFTPEEEAELRVLIAQPPKIISDLESEVSLNGDEVIPVEDGSGTFGATVNDIKNYTLDGLVTGVGKNLLANSCFSIVQRGSSFTSATTPANNDDTYLLDRWNLVSDGNDVADISRELTVKPTGAFSALKIDQETANKQCGFVQILEEKDAAALINGVASLSFEARKGGSNATLGKLRAAIISWSSTADSVTSDVVGTWAGAGTNPTLATNWTYENTPSDLTLTTSFQKFTIENVAIDAASAKNVAVFIWIDDTNATVADLVYISKVKLELGEAATNFEAKSAEEELASCQRYYEKSYSSEVNPATVTTLGQITQIGIGGFNRIFGSVFRTEKRVPPTMVIYSPSTGATGKVRDYNSTSDVSVTADAIGTGCFNLNLTTATNPYDFHYTADAEL